MKLLTFSNHDAFQVSQMFETVFSFKPQIVERHHATLRKPLEVTKEGKKCAIFIGADTFEKLYPSFSKSKVVIVLDNPVMCTSYKDAYSVDMKVVKSFEFKTVPVNAESLKTALKKAKDVDTVDSESVEDIKRGLLPKIIESTGYSILQPIQTYLYRISNTEERHEHQADIFKSLLRGKDILELRDLKNKDITFTRWVKEPKTQEIFEAIAKAFVEMGNKKALSDIAELYQLSEYDLRYMLASLKKNGHQVINQDTLDVYLQKDYT
jgi:PHD/YefM family antitoxin component YafN of YafNO toxin-antitoxin module